MSDIIINPYVFVGVGGGYDPDAQAMFDARAAVGNEPTEPYKQAISDYVEEIKAIPGFWDDIIQLVVMAGATTINGACIAIKGNNLTPISMVNTDVNIKTGVKGNGTNKYFQTGYGFPITGTSQNDFHCYACVTEGSSLTTRSLFGRGTIAIGSNAWILNTPGSSRANNEAADSGGVGGTGGFGLSRASSTAYTRMYNGNVSTVTRNSGSPPDASLYVLARGFGTTPQNFSNARILIWAMGPAVTLTNYATPRANLIAALNTI
jgi:hypothetical protein